MGTNSPDLELVAKKTEIKAAASERRRRPRLNLSTEQFRLLGDDKTYAVTDVSETGMALRIIDPEDFFKFTLTTLVSGTLSVHREKIELQARVKRVGAGQIGLEFHEMKAAVRTKLLKHLDPAVLGAELRPIPADGDTLWFHASSGTDLIVTRQASDGYKRLVIYILGSFILWEEERGLLTGRLGASQLADEVRGILRFEMLALEEDPKPDQAKLRIAKTLVMSSNLPLELKTWCSHQLSPG